MLRTTTTATLIIVVSTMISYAYLPKEDLAVTKLVVREKREHIARQQRAIAMDKIATFATVSPEVKQQEAYPETSKRRKGDKETIRGRNVNSVSDTDALMSAIPATILILILINAFKSIEDEGKYYEKKYAGGFI